jgi:hypothetical protein
MVDLQSIAKKRSPMLTTKQKLMLTIEKAAITILLFPFILLVQLIKWALFGYSAIREWIYIKNEGRKARKWYRENIDREI